MNFEYLTSNAVLVRNANKGPLSVFNTAITNISGIQLRFITGSLKSIKKGEKWVQITNWFTACKYSNN
jgi:hypothetical protein